jgi:hypothetical protein
MAGRGSPVRLPADRPWPAREVSRIASPESLRGYLSVPRNEGTLACAAEENKALLRSNLSASAVQWHGDAAILERRSFVSCYWLKAENLPSPPARFGRVWIAGASTQEPDEPKKKVPSIRQDLQSSTGWSETARLNRDGPVSPGVLSAPDPQCTRLAVPPEAT